ncbi:sugar ABC transporter permease [Listeria monocytogenes]|nr:sugar ABC transporter permease [Listeria monocytogenes]EAA0286250.1 sugar ABC transporter permease [Listeria monocytogenes]EAA0289388.1 sugar ABC transporter permease [Listeria monocytogenes]EAA0412131.1 sugar ABC transporter permease [Listeria monocytogenes]EAC2688215.1 sugar ABC transporter permease [Listeria monocytogenes]
MEVSRKLSKETGNRINSLIYIGPAIIFMVFLIGIPLIQVIWDSFHAKSLTNPNLNDFVGFENFKKVLTDDLFTNNLKNTVVWTAVSVIGELILGLFVGIALNQKIRGRVAFRSMIIVPWIVPIAVAGLTWTWMLNPDYGIINYLLVKTGLIEQSVYWLGNKATALLTVTFINIWRTFPYWVISILAGLQSIPDDLYEAASIDGANLISRFFNVTLPNLKNVLSTLIFMHIVWTSVNFDFIWITTEGGPNYASETLPIMIYRFAMKNYDIGKSSALSVIMIVVLLAFFAIVPIYQMVRKKLKGAQ